MTKRPSPFETSIYRQSKVHLNDYENDLTIMKEIEERTLKKLIEGSKKCSLIKDLNSKDKSHNMEQENKNFMQKCVTNYFTVNGKKTNETGKQIMGNNDTVSKCFFCEANTSSIYKCIHCLELFCAGCSFVNYDSYEYNRTCLSCS